MYLPVNFIASLVTEIFQILQYTFKEMTEPKLKVLAASAPAPASAL